MSFKTIIKVEDRNTVTTRDKKEFRAYATLEAEQGWGDKGSKKARLFWDDEFKNDDGEVAVLGEHPEYGARGVDADVDKAWAADNKHHIKLTKDAIRSALARVVGPVEANEVQYSRKAGCSMCACSPGFIISDRVRSLFADKAGINRVAEFRLSIRYYNA